MKCIVLGSGTSTGVPRIGDDWGDCDPDEPRNRRTRVSILLESAEGRRILVDTSTDLRQQLLANRIDAIDAVFWTHDHADHCHGIDDLRVLRYGRGGPIPGYASGFTVERLRRRFDYVFAGQHGYPTIVSLESLDRLRLCAGFAVNWCQMPHGPAQSTGLKPQSAPSKARNRSVPPSRTASAPWSSTSRRPAEKKTCRCASVTRPDIAISM